MRAENMPMPNDLYYKVLNHFQTILEPGTLHSHLALPPTPTSQPLLPQAAFFDHVIINQNQFSASRRSVSYADAVVAVRINGQLWVGELVDIFVIKQMVVGVHRLGHVHWFKPSKVDTINTVWDE